MGAGTTGIDPEEAGDQGDMLLENSHFNAGVKKKYIYIYKYIYLYIYHTFHIYISIASVPHFIQEYLHLYNLTAISCDNTDNFWC